VVLGDAANLVLACKDHQMLHAEDVKDAEEALNFDDPLGVLPHHDVYTHLISLSLLPHSIILSVFLSMIKDLGTP
jgi:hypothetical protein